MPTTNQPQRGKRVPRMLSAAIGLALAVMTATAFVPAAAQAAPIASPHPVNTDNLARVVSPDPATVLISGSSSATSTTTSTAKSASPSLSVGYGCLVQTWPGTNVHPCGYVISNAVAKGIFNALKVLGSAAGVAACTAALVALHVDHGTAASLCGTAAAILAGFANWGSKCMFIINTPHYLAGHILAVNC